MRCRAALVLALLGGCSLIVDPPPEAKHPEFLVNFIMADDQANAAVVFNNERYLVLWQDSSLTPPDTSMDAIRGRFVSKTGVAEPGDFPVNDTTLGSQNHPQVAAIGNSMLVVWVDESGEADLRGRIVASGGEFLSAEIAINSTISGVQEEHQLIAAPPASKDCFLVVWADASMEAPDTALRAIRGRRFDPLGMPCDSADPNDFVINTRMTGDQHEPHLARGMGNGMLAVWTDIQLGDGGDISGAVLGLDGRPLGNDFIVNTTRSGIQEQPYVIALRDGRYLVAWTDGSSSSVDIDGKAVRARLLDANGTSSADDFVLNARTQGDQGHPRMLQVPDGRIFLSFEDASALAPDTDGVGVRALWLANDGTPLGDDHQVNTYYASDQEDSALAMDSAGNVLVLWEDGGGSPPDDSGDSVRGRIYSPGP